MTTSGPRDFLAFFRKGDSKYILEKYFASEPEYELFGKMDRRTTE
ncbi:hypothetical protein [Hafnia paralvei]|nr:hypothetical protein [Hafnia paralvei]